MQTEKEPLQVRLPRGSGQKLKILAAKTGTSISAIVQEALDQWWKQNPKALAEGPLFTDESAVATPEATKEEPAATLGSATQSPPQKAPAKGSKKSVK